VAFEQLRDGNALFFGLPLQQVFVDVLLRHVAVRVVESVTGGKQARGMLLLVIGQSQFDAVHLRENGVVNRGSARPALSRRERAAGPKKQG
jgi:hypothetical protein